MSLDISAMYPSMTISRTLLYLNRVVKKFMSGLWSKELIALVLMLARVVLESLVVQLNGNYYLQIRGTAMGTNCAVQLANIFGFEFSRLLFLF